MPDDLDIEDYDEQIERYEQELEAHQEFTKIMRIITFLTLLVMIWGLGWGITGGISDSR